MREIYIGLMSGTSLDAIDAVVVDFSATPPQLLASLKQPYTKQLQAEILALCTPGENEINRVGQMDVQLGELFASASLAALQKSGISPTEVRAIGSHGQTIRHQPNDEHAFTLQIGDPNRIAAKTRITTIADFRRRDIASGGQGAPLVPAFHAYLFRHAQHNRAILNIGGIANLTILPADTTKTIIGFDTGPGNILMDAWIQEQLGQLYDAQGAWAATGNVHASLLDQLLTEHYIHQPPPKSTGRELFNRAWLEQQLQHLHHVNAPISPADIQATLLEFTAMTISKALQKYAPDTDEIIVCGGGAYNTHLMQRLKSLVEHPLHSCAAMGIAPEWIEAMAFAWLAQQTINGLPGNIPAVTGATDFAILGGIFHC